MDEKVLIEGKISNISKYKKTVLLMGLAIEALALVETVFGEYGFRYFGTTVLIMLLSYLFFILVAFFPYILGWHKVSMTVTNKRVYGCAIFGKRVDLPIDSITAVSTSAFKGIGVTTAAGIIKFKLISNYQEIHSTISRLLVDRQSTKNTSTVIKQEIPQSNADELKKYKDLLDSGVITQEEFDAKKKQLLGL